MVREVRSSAEFHQALHEAGGKLVVVDFTAKWCDPCQMISPIFEQLSAQYSDVVFLKVNVDEAQDVSKECSIRSMPTFWFFKHGSKVDEFSGADPSRLIAGLHRWR